MPKEKTLSIDRMRGSAPAPLPDAFEDTLPSGLEVKWRMPDPFTLIAFDTTIPDPITAAVIKLLNEEKASTPDFDPRKFRNDAQSIKGMYGLAAAMLEHPKLDPNREYGDGNGTLGRREIGFMDITSMYWLFRTRTRLPPSASAGADDAAGVTDVAQDSGNLRTDASAADGGE